MAFWTTHNDGTRWWLVDPAGNLTRTIGLNSVDTDPAADSWQDHWPSKAAWHASIAQLMADAGMNTVGSFGNEVIPGLARTPLLGFLGGYAADQGVEPKSAAAMGLIMRPDFEHYCMDRAHDKCEPDDENIIGYATDNELAWTAANNDQLRRYFSVIETAIRTVDPNHMILGPRIHRPSFGDEDLFRIGGRKCQALCINYYGVDKPNTTQTAKWARWAGGRPYIVTEFYAMAYRGVLDGLSVNNSHGAGEVVTNQADRAAWFKAFANRALDDVNCLGYHWFRYQDEPSLGGANKGIVGVKFSEYTTLIDQMSVTNRRISAMSSA